MSMMIFPSSGLPTTQDSITPYTRSPAVVQFWHSGTNITTRPAACAFGFFFPAPLTQFAFVISRSGPKNPCQAFQNRAKNFQMVNKRSQPCLYYGCKGPPRTGSDPGKKKCKDTQQGQSDARWPQAASAMRTTHHYLSTADTNEKVKKTFGHRAPFWTAGPQ